MTTSAKHTMHKSCSCAACKRGRGSTFGKTKRRSNEKKLRSLWRRALRRLGLEADSSPISSPYTD